MSNESLGPCEVVGIFHAADDLEDAIDELMHSGFDRAELSLLASEDAVAEKLKPLLLPGERNGRRSVRPASSVRLYGGNR